ncbi:peptidase S46 [Sphingobacterium faecium NBRC 15299]|uniref:S46 family peptidase n=1 Tax=Sphingobacterium faecium TaxID=34087 RepID=UPI000D3CDD85|nr:S46 family peptidase [Sphingobacterium faecium]PTX07881.1 peptidase S46-like protein [Sphingobacterium faecium]GEM65657.1 peptidase S46 [Sphingobacterium faecium NBRC 15299]
MKKLWIFLLLITASLTTFADEGMWFLMHLKRLNEADMQKKGLKLTAEEIYSINNSSLKDAIVQFNGGCTAEIVSDQGLVFTNHHCGYGAIAELSTPENDHLTNGFWAKTKSEELKPKSLFVRFFVRMDDVSKRILSLVNDKMSESERQKTINQEIAKIEKENSENGKYIVNVKSFYNGNEYYYFVYQDFNDVRLVGTPPNSIGKFGGDTDNWEWPRHTGDFSIFRVYGDKNGNPAEYAQDNVPLKPKHFLPISLKGFKEGDFAMILGYPGRTNRWMPAGGIDQNVKFAYPAWVEASKTGMDAMKKYMDKDQAVKINYASKYSQVANYWKNRQGMIDALTLHKTAITKARDEAKFNKWANKKENKAQYGDVIATINAYYASTNEKARHDNYLSGMLRSSTLAALPYSIGNGLDMYVKSNEAKRKELLPRLQAAIASGYEKMHLPLEEDVLIDELNLYAKKGGNIAPYISELASKNNNDLTSYVREAIKNSIFASEERLNNFLSNPTAIALDNDPLYKLSSALLNKYRESSTADKDAADKFEAAHRKYVAGVLASNPKGKFYPDANSTLRLTYGSIKSLPADKRNDAAENYYTTLKGTIAKYKKGDEEFDLPQRLIDLQNSKDYGRYADKAGHLPVNFLSDNDITGGNSGSPVINGNGELIGLAFDGNIEAMAGDVIFDHKLQRTISVDIRYVLFVIDKFAGATNIINELKIVE